MDFVNVKDVVRANIMGMESDVENEILNIGSGKSTTIRKLAYMLIDIMGKDVKPRFKPRNVIVTERRADIRKAKDLLGFEPEIGLREGMREVAEDIKKHPEMY